MQAVPSLTTQRRWLKAQAYKYNVIDGSSLRRKLLLNGCRNIGFLKALRTRADPVIEAPSIALVTDHFK